jgi:hypothetical protein
MHDELQLTDAWEGVAERLQQVQRPCRNPDNGKAHREAYAGNAGGSVRLLPESDSVRSSLSRPLLSSATMLIFMFCLIASGSAASGPATLVQTAVDRGLHYLRQEAFHWKETRGCAACHHAATMIWTFNEARAHGYAVDEPALKEITAWAFKDMQANSLTEQAPPRDVLNLGWVYVLLSTETTRSSISPTGEATALGRGISEEEPIRSARATLLRQIVTKQASDGSWGRPLDERVPLGGPVEDITILARVALLESDDPSAAANRSIQKAGDWLSANGDKTSRQGGNLRLLMEVIEGRRTLEETNAIQTIEAEQRPDGGWSQTSELASDAYATGQSLYVLIRTGVTPTDPAVGRGLEYLIRTQRPDGSWPMSSRVKAKNLAPIIGAGTAWAVLALIRASP